MAETREETRTEAPLVEMASGDITGRELTAIDNRQQAAGANARNRMEVLLSEVAARRDKFQIFLGDTVKFDAFREVASRAMIKTPTLVTDCTASSLFLAMLDCAKDGLVPDGKLAALIPRKDMKAGVTNATYLPMVQGLMTIAYRGGQIKDIDAEVVYAGESFRFKRGTEAFIDHEPKLDRDISAAIEGAYCIVNTVTCGRFIEIIGAKELAKISAVNRGAAYGPGKDWPGEMAKKACIRRIWKRLPRTPAMDAVYDRDSKTYVVLPEIVTADGAALRPRGHSVKDPFANEPVKRLEVEELGQSVDQAAQDTRAEKPHAADAHDAASEDMLSSLHRVLADAEDRDELLEAQASITKGERWDGFHDQTKRWLEQAAADRLAQLDRVAPQMLIQHSGGKPAQTYGDPTLWADDFIKAISGRKTVKLNAFWAANQHFVAQQLDNPGVTDEAGRIVKAAEAKGLSIKRDMLHGA